MSKKTVVPVSAALGVRARLFHALSDETRLAILDLLRRGERCVCDLQEALDSQQSRLSFHLKVLREVGLVTDRKDGRWSYYAIDPTGLAAASEVALAMMPGSAAAPSPELHQLSRKRPQLSVSKATGGAARVGSAGDSGTCCG